MPNTPRGYPLPVLLDRLAPVAALRDRSGGPHLKVTMVDQRHIIGGNQRSSVSIGGSEKIESFRRYVLNGIGGAKEPRRLFIQFQ